LITKALVEECKGIKERCDELIIKLDAAGYAKINEVKGIIRDWQDACDQLRGSIYEAERNSISYQVDQEDAGSAEKDVELYIKFKKQALEKLTTQAEASSEIYKKSFSSIKDLKEEVESYR